jgi:hypothetical protein
VGGERRVGRWSDGVLPAVLVRTLGVGYQS